MYTNMINLDAERHRGLRFEPEQSYLFARKRMMVPLVFSEMILAAREMPILFPVGSDLPHALLGTRPEENAHVRDSGHWLGRYIPADIRRYPFSLAELPPEMKSESSAATQYAVQFDADAPHLSSDKGHRLLNDEGKPDKVLQRIQQVLLRLQKEQQRTVKMVQALDSAGLLVERNVQVPGGGDAANDSADNSFALTGLRIVDPAALGKLDTELMSRLRDSEALSLAHMHMLSLSNLRDGTIARKTARSQASKAAADYLSREETIGFNF